jgi:hypothetical protein
MDVVSIGNIATSVSETFKFNEENVVFLNTGDIFDGEILHSEEVSPVGLPGQAKKTIEENDILFSEIRPINRMPYRVLCNGELQKSLEARTGVVLVHSHFTPLHKIRYGVAPSSSLLFFFSSFRRSRERPFRARVHVPPGERARAACSSG